MTIKSIAITIIALAFGIAAKSASTTISGTHTEYAGYKIIFSQKDNFIIDNEEKIGTAPVDDQGNFSFTFDNAETKPIFLTLGVFKAYLYIEPGKTYNIALPPFIPKNQEDILNPFFEPEVVHLHLAKPDFNELNYKITRFDIAFDSIYDKCIKYAVLAHDKTYLPKNIHFIDSVFAGADNNPYFSEYIKYKKGLLEFHVNKAMSTNIILKYFSDGKFQNNNPSYKELFNQVFTNYFFKGNHVDMSKHIEHKGTIDSLFLYLSNDTLISQSQVKVHVLLQNLYAEFYKPNFSKNATLHAIKGINERSDQPEIKVLASGIEKEITQLLIGHKAPNFDLLSVDSIHYTLDSLHGQYVYLNFCLCVSYACMKEFAALQAFKDKFHEYVKVISIVADQDYETVQEFANSFGYDFPILHAGNHPELLEQYKVVGYPVYYLIDPDGKLALNPAKSPGEQFAGQLYIVLKKAGVLAEDDKSGEELFK